MNHMRMSGKIGVFFGVLWSLAIILLVSEPVFAGNPSPAPGANVASESEQQTLPVSSDKPEGTIKKTSSEKDKPLGIGAKITMSFTNAPVGYILQSLGRLFDISFSISASAASKTVSVELNGVTFEEAVSMIADASQIDISKQGTSMYIVKALSERKDIESEKEREIREQRERLETGMMEVVTVKNVDVEDVRAALNSTFGEENSKIVKISKVATDDKRQYNSLLLYAANKKILDSVKEMIQTIDVEKPMVEIEVLFMELTTSSGKNSGVDWTVMKNPLQIAESAPGSLPGNGIQTSGGTVTETVVDNFTTARFGQFWRLSPWEAEATVTAMASSGRGRVLANPRIRVLSGRKANFASETQVPILTKNADGDINTEWKNVGIGLDILPVVLRDDKEISLKVIPRVSSITGEKKLGDVTAPIIAERKAETEVILMPEETMVIGGLMNDRDVRSMAKVPILGDIPIFGELFKSRKTEKEKSTVIVFLKPHLVSTGNSRPTTVDRDIKNLWDGKAPAEKNADSVIKNVGGKGPRYSDAEYEMKFNEISSKYGKDDSVKPAPKQVKVPSQTQSQGPAEKQGVKNSPQTPAKPVVNDTPKEQPAKTPENSSGDEWTPPME